MRILPSASGWPSNWREPTYRVGAEHRRHPSNAAHYRYIPIMFQQLNFTE